MTTDPIPANATGADLIQRLAQFPETPVLPDTLEAAHEALIAQYDLLKESTELIAGLFAVREMKLDAKPGEINLTLNTKIATIFAEVMHDLFLTTGGVNYVEWAFTYQGEGDEPVPVPYCMTLQKKLMKTPHELRREAETELRKHRDFWDALFLPIGNEYADWKDYIHKQVLLINKRGAYVGRIVPKEGKLGLRPCVRQTIAPPAPLTEAIIRDHEYFPGETQGTWRMFVIMPFLRRGEEGE